MRWSEPSNLPIEAIPFSIFVKRAARTINKRVFFAAGVVIVQNPTAYQTRFQVGEYADLIRRGTFFFKIAPAGIVVGV